MKNACVLALCLCAVATSLSADEPFHYVRSAGNAPPPRFHDIENGLPGALTREQLLADVDPNNSGDWTLGWFTYGENNSRSVGVGLRSDQASSTLYIDLDRDKQFSRNEQISRTENDPTRWSAALGAEFLTERNDYAQVNRSILIRRSPVSGGLQIATQGVMAGTIGVAGKPMAAMRLDRNANGLWFDSFDRILLDTNHDGDVDSIDGRISCGSICVLDGKRFVLQSDLLGESLGLVELRGLGKVVPKIELQSKSAKISEVTGAIVSRSGVRAPIRGMDIPVECPIGEYRIESLEFKVDYQDVRYWFRFYSLGNAKDRFEVKVDESVDVNLIGDIELASELASMRGRRENTLTITPTLKTGSGLFLSGCMTGRGQPSLENRLMTASSHDGKVIDNNSTGFS